METTFMNTENPWYALYAGSNQQLKVRNILITNHIEAYVPCKMAKRTHARKTVMKEVPIMPTYVFFRCQEDQLSIVKSVPGVSTIVLEYLHHGHYVQIPDCQIRRLEDAIKVDADRVQFFSSAGKLKKGMEVRICDGPFIGITGTVDRIEKNKNTNTVFLLTGTIGCAAIEISPEHLELI